jgi:hypothetical protein
MKSALVVNCRTDEYDVYIGRPGPYGNPFIVGVHGNRSEVVLWHREWIDGVRNGPNGEEPPTREQILSLRGKRLGCWCRGDQQCHGDYLAILANIRKASLFRCISTK